MGCSGKLMITKFFLELDQKPNFSSDTGHTIFAFMSLSLFLWKIELIIGSSLGWASQVAQMVKNLPAVQKTWVQSQRQEDTLEEEMATHSSIILAWRIPWTVEPGGLRSVGLQRVSHNWATFTSLNFSPLGCCVVQKNEYKASSPEFYTKWILKKSFHLTSSSL